MPAAVGFTNQRAARIDRDSILLGGELRPGLAVYDVGEAYATTHFKTRINIDCAAVIKNPAKPLVSTT